MELQIMHFFFNLTQSQTLSYLLSTLLIGVTNLNGLHLADSKLGHSRIQDEADES
jgi:hypothetical protein